MKAHKALLDTAAWVVHLDSPMHGIIICCNSLRSPYGRLEPVRHSCYLWVSWCLFRRLVRHVSRSGCRVHNWTTAWHYTYLQRVIQDDTQGVSWIEDTIEGTVGQRVYLSEFFTLRLCNIICEEGSILKAMCELLTFECRHHQEQISFAPTSTFFLINLPMLRSISVRVIIKTRSIQKTFLRLHSLPGTCRMSILLYHLDSPMLLHILCTWWTPYLCRNWTNSLWSSLTIF
jgi:hypothetical protein